MFVFRVSQGPVVFANLREIAVALDTGWRDDEATTGTRRRPPSDALQPYLPWLWGAALLLLLPCRAGGSLLYLYSLVNWLPMLASLPPASQLLYHCAAVAFSFFSCGWLGQLWLQAHAPATRPRVAAQKCAPWR